MSIRTYRPRRNRAFLAARAQGLARAFQRNLPSTYQRIARGVQAFRAGRMATVTQRRNRNIYSGVGVTTQHDQRRVYSKRSMPPRKRRAWKGFVRKVNAAAEKELGSRTVIFNKTIQNSNTTAGNQISGAVYLYGKSPTGPTEVRDLYNIATYENVADPTAAAGATIDESTKFLFQSAVLDVTFKNNSTVTRTGPIILAAGEAKLEVDVYEIMVNREVGDFATDFNDFIDLLDSNLNNTKPIGGAGNEIVHTARGVTPFDLTYSLGRFRIRIMKKTKYVVPNQDTFTYQVRDPNRRTCVRRDLTANTGFNKPGWTRVIYFTAKLVPDLQVGAVADTYQEGLVVGATRKYFYKIEGMNEDRTRYVANT